MSLGPEGVDQRVVLNCERTDEEGKTQASKQKFFVVGENEAEAEDCGQCNKDRLHEGPWSEGRNHGSISELSIVLFDGSNEDTVEGGDGYLGDEHQHAEDQGVGFGDWHVIMIGGVNLSV